MIAVLSNINIEPIKLFFRDRKLYFSPFGQYRQELLNPESPLRDPSLKHVIIFLDGDELCGDALYQLPTEAVRADVIEEFESLLDMIRQFSEESGSAMLITINTIVLSPYRFTNFLEVNSEYSFRTLEQALNDRLREFAATLPTVLLLDWMRIVNTHGYANLYATNFWYQARIKINQLGLQLLSDSCDRLWGAVSENPKKVLVLDLDNTLWGGVVGDLGPTGITLSEDGQGKAYRDFQKAVRSVMQLGVLLAINSKNTESIVKDVFESNRMMVLQYDDFAATAVNWSNKAENMLDIATNLNLGIDSFVFIDDSQVEREIIRSTLPDVTVPEFPNDPADLVNWFQQEVVFSYFAKAFLTDSDRNKTQQYKARKKRVEIGAKLNIEDTIRHLEIRLNVYVDPQDMRSRISQLIQKTNQFNMTTLRYSDSEIESIIRAPDRHLFALEYEDRFGPEGIIGVAICGVRPEGMHIHNLLLSCRVLGRTVEFALLKSILTFFGPDNFMISAPFVATQRNEAAKAFYPGCGLSLEENGEYCGDSNLVLQELDRKILIDEVVVDGSQ